MRDGRPRPGRSSDRQRARRRLWRRPTSEARVQPQPADAVARADRRGLDRHADQGVVRRDRGATLVGVVPVDLGPRGPCLAADPGQVEHADARGPDGSPRAAVPRLAVPDRLRSAGARPRGIGHGGRAIEVAAVSAPSVRPVATVCRVGACGRGSMVRPADPDRAAVAAPRPVLAGSVGGPCGVRPGGRARVPVRRSTSPRTGGILRAFSASCRRSAPWPRPGEAPCCGRRAPWQGGRADVEADLACGRAGAWGKAGRQCARTRGHPGLGIRRGMRLAVRPALRPPDHTAATVGAPPSAGCRLGGVPGAVILAQACLERWGRPADVGRDGLSLGGRPLEEAGGGPRSWPCARRWRGGPALRPGAEPFEGLRGPEGARDPCKWRARRLPPARGMA